MNSQLMTPVEFDFEGRTIKGFAAEKAGVLWLHAEGETWTVESSGRARRGSKAGASGAANPGEIVAPMPGKIIKIMSAQGSKISKGDVVIVMEAMKMEYTLKAQADGVLGEVRCAAGDQVPLGQLLAKVTL